jgi:hypothetical protein
MSSGPPYFRPTVTAVNCIAEDPGTPVRMELSRIGELIIHNWDEDASNALEALGIDSVCARFVDPTVWQNTLYKIFGLERPDGLPEPLINEILRVTALVYDPEEDEFGRGDGYWTLAISVIREGDCC